MAAHNSTMQERHTNRQQYFNEQAYTTEKYVIPYLSSFGRIDQQARILEIGCGEGGNLKPFVEMGCDVTGVDISSGKIDLANSFLEGSGEYTLILKDIYETDPAELGVFDVVMMRDVIEHIPNQERFMGFVKRFLHPESLFFLGFPPWQMPFGGHQQICRNSFLSRLPYFHLLPSKVYGGILRLGGEDDNRIRNLLELQKTGISVERFKRIVETEGYKILDESPWLFNPHYEAKFNLKPRRQWKVITGVPVLRNYLTTCYYFVLQI